MPKVLEPSEVNALLAALRHWRDRAMVEAMVLGGLRCCEVVGLRLGAVRAVERRVFIPEGKGGHQRLVPISPRFFTSVSRYFSDERPRTNAERVFIVLKCRRRGEPLSIDGLEQIVRAAKQRTSRWIRIATTVALSPNDSTSQRAPLPPAQGRRLGCS